MAFDIWGVRVDGSWQRNLLRRPRLDRLGDQITLFHSPTLHVSRDSLSRLGELRGKFILAGVKSVLRDLGYRQMSAFAVAVMFPPPLQGKYFGFFLPPRPAPRLATARWLISLARSSLA